MNKATQMLGGCFAAVLSLLVWGCAGSATDGPKFNETTGAHPAGWIQNHWEEFVKNPSQCTSCHGSTKDPATSGGIAKVSCFTCHANGPWHPAGWGDPSQHGRLGAQLAPSQDPTAMAGYAHCAKCHGSNYDNPVGITPSCKSCHTKAPHPDKPWVSTSLSEPTHVQTDQGNAPECFKCHANGANSDLKPATPAPAGTTPGCFNNTMCHGTNITPVAGPGASLGAGMK
jgi:hypothetical protein